MPRPVGTRIRATTALESAPQWHPTLTETAPHASPRERPNPHRIDPNTVLRTVLATAPLPDTALGIPLDTSRKQRQMADEAAVTPSQEINDVMDDHSKCPNRDLPEVRKVTVIIYHSEPSLVQVKSSA